MFEGTCCIETALFTKFLFIMHFEIGKCNVIISSYFRIINVEFVTILFELKSN